MHVEAASKTGALPKKGCRSLSHVGGPGVSESTGSLIYRLAGGQVSAGLCPSRCRRGRGGTSGSLLVLQPPWVGPPGHPAVLWAQSWGEAAPGWELGYPAAEPTLTQPPSVFYWVSQVAWWLKKKRKKKRRLPVQETQLPSLGQEDPTE